MQPLAPGFVSVDPYNRSLQKYHGPYLFMPIDDFDSKLQVGLSSHAVGIPSIYANMCLDDPVNPPTSFTVSLLGKPIFISH